MPRQEASDNDFHRLMSALSMDMMFRPIIETAQAFDAMEYREFGDQLQKQLDHPECPEHCRDLWSNMRDMAYAAADFAERVDADWGKVKAASEKLREKDDGWSREKRRKDRSWHDDLGTGRSQGFHQGRGDGPRMAI